MPIGLFQPASNPAPSPAGFMSSAASIYNAMNEAAAQAQKQQQVQQQKTLMDQFNKELEMRKQGYTPLPKDKNGLTRRGDVDPGRVVNDPFGRSWMAPEAKPAKAEKPATSPQQTFTDTRNMIERGATSLNYSPVPGSDPQAVEVPGSGGQFFHVPTNDETLASKLKTEGANGAPSIDTEHFSTPVSINHRTGEVTPLKLPAGVTHNDKPEKTSRYTFSYHTDDSGTVHVLRGDPDTGDVTEVKSVKGAGPKRKDPDAAPGERTLTPGQKQMQDRFNARELRSANTQKNTRLQKAESDFAKDLKDSGSDAGKVQAAKDRLWNSKQAAQDEYEQSLKDLGMNVQHFDYGGQRTQMQATPQGDNGRRPQTQASGTGAKSKGPLTNLDTVQQYLQKAGGDKDKARKLAKADGWEF